MTQRSGEQKFIPNWPRREVFGLGPTPSPEQVHTWLASADPELVRLGKAEHRIAELEAQYAGMLTELRLLEHAMNVLRKYGQR